MIVSHLLSLVIAAIAASFSTFQLPRFSAGGFAALLGKGVT